MRSCTGRRSSSVIDREVIPPPHAAYITFFRAIGAVLITNSHFTGVYPSDIVANGGLLGDVMFFAAAGYSLNPRGGFPGWYLRRIIRVYIPVWFVTIGYLLIGWYSAREASLRWWLVYPTNYHFIASIMVLYVPMVIAVKLAWVRDRLAGVIALVAVAHAVLYLIAYDANYYHIDNVREPMIRLLFLEAMLVGAYFRHRPRASVAPKPASWVLLVATGFGYAGTKFALVSGLLAPAFQIANHWLIMGFLYLLLVTMGDLEGSLRALPASVQRVAVFIAGMTLEIYLVQYAIIPLIAPALIFPCNWVALVICIGTLAWGLIGFRNRWSVGQLPGLLLSPNAMGCSRRPELLTQIVVEVVAK